MGKGKLLCDQEHAQTVCQHPKQELHEMYGEQQNKVQKEEHEQHMIRKTEHFGAGEIGSSKQFLVIEGLITREIVDVDEETLMLFLQNQDRN